jgi:hypothetical protein
MATTDSPPPSAIEDPSDAANPSGANPEVEGLLIALGQFLSQHGPALHRNADELERFGAKLAPVWSQFAVIGPISELAPKLDRLQASSDAVSKRDGASDSTGNAADHTNADPYLSALLEDLESSLTKKLDHSLQTRLDAVVRILENQRSTVTSATKSEFDSSTAMSLKARVTELQQDLLAARRETKTAREEASAVRQEARDARADVEILNQQVRRLTSELGQWRQIALGPELSQEESCRRHCDELLAEALKGEGGALALIGNLITFQAAPAERLPNLLKDVGESYYGWRPRTQPGPLDDDSMESALIRFLLGRCERSGVKNRIEPIRPNARLNSDRHRSEGGGGTMVIEVRGWVVLRENGQTLHRANVLAR